MLPMYSNFAHWKKKKTHVVSFNPLRSWMDSTE